MKKIFVIALTVLCSAQTIHAWYDAHSRKMAFYRHSVNQIQKVIDNYNAQLPGATTWQIKAINAAVSNLSQTMALFKKKITNL